MNDSIQWDGNELDKQLKCVDKSTLRLLRIHTADATSVIGGDHVAFTHPDSSNKHSRM